MVASMLVAAACEPLPPLAAATRAGETPDHHEMWRLDCDGSACDAKAREVCAGSYMTLSDSNVATGSTTVVGRSPFWNAPVATTTISGHRAVMIVCNTSAQGLVAGSGREREQEERRFVGRLSRAEPDDESRRCEYWREALDKPDVERMRPMVRKWIKDRAAKACVEPEHEHE